MTISTKIIGNLGHDNSLYLKLDTGQKVIHMIFDCGQCSFHYLGKAILQDIDHIFISHCHIDHIAGFDGIFRYLYSRPNPVMIWGPSGITEIMHNRFKGFTWNLIKNSMGKIIVNEIDSKKISSSIFYCKEGFSLKHLQDEKKYTPIIYSNSDFLIECSILDHQIDCLGFKVVESGKIKINIEKMNQYGLKPGKWCSLIKDKNINVDEDIEISGKLYKKGYLEENLLDCIKGNSIAYVTDIIMNESNQNKLLDLIKGVGELIIESTYLNSEEELAKKNYHLTVKDATTIANKANINKLTLFHVSDRYNKNDIKDMLKIARENFKNTFFPEHWDVE